MFDPEVDEAIKRMRDELVRLDPTIGHLLDRMRSGELGEVEGLASLMTLVQSMKLGPEVERIAMGAFGSLKTERGELVPPVDGDAPPVLTKKSTGVPMLNPLYEAAILERLQFDGDVPELRSGPLPRDAAPAVPVNTSVASPVALGVQLKEASDQVRAELDAAEHGFAGEVEKMLTDAQDAGMSEEESMALVRQQEQEGQLVVPTGVPGYEAGQLPALRDVGTPSGSALAALTPEERQEAAHRAMSTTQGRRSALSVIEEIMLVGLESEGFPMTARPPGQSETVHAHARWTANLGSAASTQSNFSFIHVAARALTRQLVDELRETAVADPVLEVLTVDAVDVRTVGWAARVVSR